MIKLLKTRILVEALDKEIRESGIILLDKSNRMISGKVISKGSGNFNEDGTRERMEVEIGDVVYHSSYAGIPVNLKGKNYLVMNEDDIICVLPPGEEIYCSKVSSEFLGEEIKIR